MVELALILPFLFFVCFGTLEVLNFVRYEQFLSVVSREVGRAAFDCAYNTPGSVHRCLENAVEKAFPASPTGVSGVLQNSGIIISVWQCNEDASGNKLRGTLVGQRFTRSYTEQGTPITIDSSDSHFDDAGNTISTLNSYSSAKGRIVTAEAFYSFPVLPKLKKFFTGKYYAVTIL